MYERTSDGDLFVGVHLLQMADGAIGLVTAFMDPALAGRFEMPPTIALPRPRSTAR